MSAAYDADWVAGQYPDADPTDGKAEQDAPRAAANIPAEETLYPPPSDPLAVARHLVKQNGLSDSGGVLLTRWWRGTFYQWTGTHWREIADARVRAALYHILGRAQYWKADQTELIPWSPTRRKIGDVMEAFQALVLTSERVDPPAWIGGEGGGRVLAVRNGLLDLDTRELVAHTPRLFNLVALPYDYDPDAPEPTRWLEFLTELWPDDPDAIALLQEWFGYVLSGETSLQKILLLVGPPRSGKGTIARVLAALVGRENWAGPTMASLGTNFGLEPLLDKALAVISDARLGGSTNVVVERLLAISGEDGLTIDRKYKAPWTGRIPARFVLLSNELPNLGDASGAIATRFLVGILVRSWLGNENQELTNELLPELPGVLHWSLDGLDRLRKHGRFTVPASSQDAVADLADLVSPVAAFVRGACELDPAYEVHRRTLYLAWRQWSKDHGRDRPTTDAVFGRDLRAAFPRIRDSRPRMDGKRQRTYEGIRLSDEYTAYMGASTAHNSSDPGPSWTTQDHKPPTSGNAPVSGPGNPGASWTTPEGDREPGEAPAQGGPGSRSADEEHSRRSEGMVQDGPGKSPLRAVHDGSGRTPQASPSGTEAPEPERMDGGQVYASTAEWAAAGYPGLNADTTPTHRCGKCGKTHSPPRLAAAYPHTGCGGLWAPIDPDQDQEAGQ